MLITPSNLAFFFTAVESRFWQAYKTADLWHERVATTVPVSTEVWLAGWIGMLDKVREWTGSRIKHQPAPQTYQVAMQLYEQTQSIDKYKLMDDQFGIYNPTIDFMGKQSAKWPDYQLRDLILNTGTQTGSRQNGLDALTHWNTAHPVDFYDSSKGTYCNDFSGGVSVGGVTVGGAFTTNGFNTLWEEFASRKSESGEALGIIADLTMGPPQLKAPMTTILQSQFYAPPQMGVLGSGSGANAAFVGSMENPLRGWTDLLTLPDFAAAPTTWFMLCTTAPQKPFTWLLRQAPNFVARINPDDPAVFDNHEFIYGADMRGAPAWSLAWLSAKSAP